MPIEVGIRCREFVLTRRLRVEKHPQYVWIPNRVNSTARLSERSYGTWIYVPGPWGVEVPDPREFKMSEGERFWWARVRQRGVMWFVVNKGLVFLLLYPLLGLTFR